MESLKLIPQDRQSIDFAESERQKSKNLFYVEKSFEITQYGVTYKYDSTTQRLTLNGTVREGENTWITISPKKVMLKPGRYTFQVKHISGNYNNVSFHGCFIKYNNGSKNIIDTSMNLKGDNYNQQTLTEDAYLGNISLQASAGNVFDNYVIQFQLEEGNVPTEIQQYNGAIVNEKQLNETVDKRELIHGRTKVISIQDSKLDTLKAYFDLFETAPQENYFCGIGYLETSKFKDLVGEPSGFANYTSCCIKKYCRGFSDGRFNCYELLAFADHGLKMAKGYIYMNAYDTVVFTGWNVIGG